MKCAVKALLMKCAVKAAVLMKCAIMAPVLMKCAVKPAVIKFSVMNKFLEKTTEIILMLHPSLMTFMVQNIS